MATIFPEKTGSIIAAGCSVIRPESRPITRDRLSKHKFSARGLFSGQM